jgi:prophage regulatory protein
MTTPDMILRLPAVRSRCGLSRSSIYLKIRKGEFPRPISLGARAVGWLASEVSLWLADRVAVSRNSTSVPPGALPESRP